MSNTPWSPARQSSGPVQTWVSSQWKFVPSQGHFSTAINKKPSRRKSVLIAFFPKNAPRIRIMLTISKNCENSSNPALVCISSRESHPRLCTIRGGFQYIVFAAFLERVRGIEPPSSAWEAAALPLSYTRARRSYLIQPGLRRKGPPNLTGARRLPRVNAPP